MENYKKKMIKIIGNVVEGYGISKNRIIVVNELFSDLDLYPGTLNVVCNKPVFFDKAKADFVFDNRFFFFSCTVNSVSCFIYRWFKCPGHVFEIVSPVKLREILLNNEVKIMLDEDVVSKNSFLNVFLWKLFWYKRTNLFYVLTWYPFLVGKVIDFNFKYLNFSSRSSI